MMTTIFAREPVFTNSKTLFAYQFVYRNGLNGSLPLDFSSFSVDDEHPRGLSIDDLLQLNMTIVNLLPDAILDFAETFSPNDVIVEISEINTKPSTAMLEQISALKNAGFALIANQHQLDWPEFMSLVSYVKLNIIDNTPDELIKYKQNLAEYGIKIIATHVHTSFQFEQCATINIDYMQGFFFLEKETHNDKPIPANKFAFLQLMAEIAKQDLDIAQLEEIFQKDPTLSFLLIKFINNPLVNKSHKITSIRHALNYLGEIMLRRFVAIISLAGLNSDRPNELLNLSLSRAKYCELLDSELSNNNEQMSAFLVGLFSLLDVILSKDMTQLLTRLELDENISHALVEKTGPFVIILESAKSMETGDWGELFKISAKLKLPKEHLFELHRRAVRWQHDMTTAISPSFPIAKPRPALNKLT